MADGSILDALDALKKLEESLKSRDAEFREREAALQEHGSKIEEDRRGPHQGRAPPPGERGFALRRGEGKRAPGKEIGERETADAGRGEGIGGTRQKGVRQENPL